MKTLYTAHATATGDGRNGHVKSDDGLIDFDLKMPRGLGGEGGTTNPEQLFAAGYAACFHSALKLVARQQGADVSDSVVVAHVDIGKDDTSFGLAVTLDITLPNATADVAREAAYAAHQVCPYSKATRDNISVTLNIIE
jgi:Ohr subfamily peroxiredoxin